VGIAERPFAARVAAERAGAGDVVRIEPGHDAWVDGAEACVLIDTGVAAYAKPTD
jgi:hypothetical protein